MAQTFGVEFKIIKPLDTKAIDNYMDKCVMGIARATLDFTNTGRHFPYLTGDLNRASMLAGVSKLGDNIYGLGYSKEFNGKDIGYASKVWNYPQGTHWTNLDTYPQWYITEFNKDKNVIVESAIKQAKGTLR